MKKIAAFSIAVLAIALAGVFAVPTEQKPGYTDTPYLPGGKWRVHDAERPRPPVIEPGTASTQEEPGQPPSDAIVLFDGKDLSKWQIRHKDGSFGEPEWKLGDGYFEVVDKSGPLATKESFGDIQLHIEWMAPEKVQGEGQGRGNSGVLFMGRYEVQVLDSYDNITYADGQAGAVYGQYPPMVNASRPPGQWQTYDIVFEAPKFENGRLAKPASVTVFHNGVLLHNRQEMLGPMRHRQMTSYEPHEPEGRLMLQMHSNPVRYRNIWIRPLERYRNDATR